MIGLEDSCNGFSLDAKEEADSLEEGSELAGVVKVPLLFWEQALSMGRSINESRTTTALLE